MDVMNSTSLQNAEIIARTVKEIMFILMPDCEIIDHLFNNVLRYDKCSQVQASIQKMLAIIYNNNSNHFLTHQILESSQINSQYDENQFIKFKLKLEDERTSNRKLESQLLESKKCIKNLFDAFHQAKKCYEEEILQYKFQLQEKTCQSQCQITPKKKGRISEVSPKIFTDQSIYKRISFSQQKLINDPIQEEGESQNQEKTLRQKLEVKSEDQKREIRRLNKIIKDKADECVILKDESNKLNFIIEELNKQTSTLKELMQVKIGQIMEMQKKFKEKIELNGTYCKKLQEKNKIINELLNKLSQQKNI